MSQRYRSKKIKKGEKVGNRIVIKRKRKRKKNKKIKRRKKKNKLIDLAEKYERTVI